MTSSKFGEKHPDRTLRHPSPLPATSRQRSDGCSPPERVSTHSHRFRRADGETVRSRRDRPPRHPRVFFGTAPVSTIGPVLLTTRGDFGFQPIAHRQPTLLANNGPREALELELRKPHQEDNVNGSARFAQPIGDAPKEIDGIARGPALPVRYPGALPRWRCSTPGGRPSRACMRCMVPLRSRSGIDREGIVTGHGRAPEACCICAYGRRPRRATTD